MTLVDKARFPRDKFCGDGLTADALRRLEDLGLDPADVASWFDVHEVRVRSPWGRVTTYPLPDGAGRYAAVARRIDLDAALVELAADGRRRGGRGSHPGAARPRATGVELGFTRADDGGSVDLEADYVIGADGMWSPLRKLLGVDAPATSASGTPSASTGAASPGRPPTSCGSCSSPTCSPATSGRSRWRDGEANIGFGIRRGGR